MFSALLSPNFMPSFGKIVGAFFEICRDVRTYVRTYVCTDGAYFIDPRFCKTATNNNYIIPTNFEKSLEHTPDL